MSFAFFIILPVPQNGSLRLIPFWSHDDENIILNENDKSATFNLENEKSRYFYQIDDVPADKCFSSAFAPGTSLSLTYAFFLEQLPKKKYRMALKTDFKKKKIKLN